MHLQALSRSHDNGEVGLETALTAKDVVEFFCAEISTETGFRNGVIRMRERHTGCEDRVTTMRDVRKGTAVNEGGSIFRSLHQVGLDSVLEEHHNCTRNTKILYGERLAFIGVTEKDIFDATTEVVFACCQTENCHQFRSGCNVETSLLNSAIRSRTYA